MAGGRKKPKRGGSRSGRGSRRTKPKQRGSGTGSKQADPSGKGESKPHDGLFKRTFADPVHLAGELQISRMPQAELLARPLSPDARMTLWLLEHARRLKDALDSDATYVLLKAVWTSRGDVEALRPYLSYILEGVAPGLLELVVTRVRAQLGPRMEALMNSLADELREQGKQQGIQQGVQQGLRAGRVSMVLRLLELKFGALDPEAIRRIEAARADALDRIAERVLVASSLAEALKE